jgi:DNA-binding NtrC family response regulator
MFCSLLSTGSRRLKRRWELGATGYITIPFHGDETMTQIAKWLESGRSENQQPEKNTAAPFEGQRRIEADREAIRIPPGTTLEDLERAAVEQALQQHHGNRTHAAKELGISVRTLQRKLKAWGGAGARPPKSDTDMGTDRTSPSKAWSPQQSASRYNSFRPSTAKV